MQRAKDVFTQLIVDVIKQQGYSQDVADEVVTSTSSAIADKSLPLELRNFAEASLKVYHYLSIDDVHIPSPEPVLASSPLVVTPDDISHVTDWLEGIPTEHRGVAIIAVQMAVNYINARS